MKYLVMVTVIALFWQGISSAGDIVPVQKTVVPTATQKTVVPTATQKTPIPTATQKTPIPTATQKGTGQALSDVPIPNELLEGLKRLQPQRCEPLKNVGRAIVRCVIKKKIANYVQDNLPPLPPLP